MTVLYIEPYPGSGIGLLHKTHEILESKGYQVAVCGYGYPPLYVTDDPTTYQEIEKLVRAEIAQFVEQEAKNLASNVTREQAKEIFFELDKHWDKHRKDADFNVEEMSAPLPHLRSQEITPPKLDDKEKELQASGKLKVPDKLEDEEDTFDVFLSYNSNDDTESQPNIKIINEKLKARGLVTWFDKEQILAGQLFQDKLQEAIPKSKAVAIFVGPTGFGPWEMMEQRVFLSQCINKYIPIIPVLLPNTTDFPEKLLFLKQFNWVKFTDINNEDALNRLVTGINVVKPRESKIEPNTSPLLPQNEENKVNPEPTKTMESTRYMDKNSLFPILMKQFTDGELRDVGLNLGVDYDSEIIGTTKADKARGLIEYFEIRDKFNELVREMQRLRPRAFK